MNNYDLKVPRYVRMYLASLIEHVVLYKFPIIISLLKNHVYGPSME